MAKTIYGKGTIKFGLTSTPDISVECQVTNFSVDAAANTISVPGTYCAGPTNAAQQSTFSVSLAYLEDWGEASSLSQFLWDNDGTRVFFEHIPDDTTVPSVAGECWAVSGSYGGDGDGLWTTTAALPCVGKPTITPPVPRPNGPARHGRIVGFTVRQIRASRRARRVAF